MSEYYNELQRRLESLEAAEHELDEATSGMYLSVEDGADLNSALDTVRAQLDTAESEMAMVEADWELVENHAETILDELVSAAHLLDDAGLIDFDDQHGVRATLDDEPTALSDTRRYIDRALDDWTGVRDAASEALSDQPSNTGGLY